MTHSLRHFEYRTPLLFRVTGKHAARYLQSRLTNDIRPLAPGLTLDAAALSPQGKIQGVFGVLCDAENDYRLLVPLGGGEAVIEGFRRFIVADRVDITPLSGEMRVLHVTGTSEDLEGLVPGSAALAGIDSRNPVPFLRQGDRTIRASSLLGSKGLDIIAPAAALEEIRARAGEEIPAEAAETLRIKAGVIAFPRELNDQRLITEGGVATLVAFDKGCYAGQEVVEKVTAVGRSPRVLFHGLIPGRLESDRETKIADARGNVVGSVVSSAFDAESDATWIFASIKNDPEIVNGALFAGGLALRTGKGSYA